MSSDRQIYIINNNNENCVQTLIAIPIQLTAFAVIVGAGVVYVAAGATAAVVVCTATATEEVCFRAVRKKKKRKFKTRIVDRLHF